MGATSVTGVGIGDSNGKRKPENQCGGCGCGGAPEETEPTPPVKFGCVVKSGSNNTTSYKAGSGAVGITVC